VRQTDEHESQQQKENFWRGKTEMAAGSSSLLFIIPYRPAGANELSGSAAAEQQTVQRCGFFCASSKKKSLTWFNGAFYTDSRS
jgi:hypothetical protein